MALDRDWQPLDDLLEHTDHDSNDELANHNNRFCRAATKPVRFVPRQNGLVAELQPNPAIVAGLRPL